MAKSEKAAVAESKIWDAMEKRARDIMTAVQARNVEWLNYNAATKQFGGLIVGVELDPLWKEYEYQRDEAQEEMIDLDITTPVSLS